MSATMASEDARSAALVADAHDEQACPAQEPPQPRSRATTVTRGARVFATHAFITTLSALAAIPALACGHPTGRALLKVRGRSAARFIGSGRRGGGGFEGDDYDEDDDDDDLEGGGIVGIALAAAVLVIVLIAVALCVKFGVYKRLMKKNKTEMAQFSSTGAGAAQYGGGAQYGGYQGAGAGTVYGTPVGDAPGKPVGGGQEHLPDAAAFGGGAATPTPADGGSSYPYATPPAAGAATYPYGAPPAAAGAGTYPYGSGVDGDAATYGGAPGGYPYGAAAATGGAAAYPAPAPPYGK